MENLRISESRHIADQAFREDQAQLTARQITVNNGVAEIKGILGTEGVQNEASASSTVDTTMILNKAKLYVDGEGRAYLTELTTKVNMNVNAELKRELGMDRWFAIEFPEDVDVDEAAKALAAAASVPCC